MPFILPWLIKAYGLFLTLRITAIAALILLIPCLMFVRPRLPEVQVHSRSVRTITTSSIILWNRTWLILIAANILQALAFFVPLIYIPCSFIFRMAVE